MTTNLVINRGAVGIGVNKIQAYLNLMQQNGFINTINNQDGVFGELTATALQEWQNYANLNGTGIIDYNTFLSLVNKLKELNITTNIPVASSYYFLSKNSVGLSVYMMQQLLNEIASVNPCLRAIFVDGYFQDETYQAVKQFQYLYDLNIDGIIGKQTWDAIINVRNSI